MIRIEKATEKREGAFEFDTFRNELIRTHLLQSSVSPKLECMLFIEAAEKKRVEKNYSNHKSPFML